ncbi:MAG TPA: formylglycine-generating enzyme family protein [Pyrinomonadaceae bacterium]
MKKSVLVLLLLFAAANSQTPNRKSMVRIAGATFQMGTAAAKVQEIAAAFNISKHPDIIQAETPQHQVTISSFFLDKYEVTNSDFQKFIRRHPEWNAARIPKHFHNGNYLKDWIGTNFPKGKANHPVVNVSWYAAVAYCRSQGKRLPTEAEWEYAARGGLLNQSFPWGDEPADKTRANYGGSGIKTTTAVGSYPANAYGLFDMAGNVWEFLADEWRPYSDRPQTNPLSGQALLTDGRRSLVLEQDPEDVTTRRVIRGGSFGGAPLNLRVTYRDSHPPEGAREFVGFRCAASE